MTPVASSLSDKTICAMQRFDSALAQSAFGPLIIKGNGIWEQEPNAEAVCYLQLREPCKRARVAIDDRGIVSVSIHITDGTGYTRRYDSGMSIPLVVAFLDDLFEKCDTEYKALLAPKPVRS